MSQRPPRNEADAKLLTRLKHAVAFQASFDERVFGLDGGDRLNRVRAANGLRARLREAEVQDLSGLDQILDRAGHVLDRHGEIDPVLVVEIDAVGLETLQRFLDDLPDTLRSAVQPVRAVDLEAELGGDGDLVADRREGLADQFLVDVGAVDFRGVEERDASLVGVANHTDALGPVHARTVVAAAEAHVAEAEFRDFQAAELSGFHFVFSFCLFSLIEPPLWPPTMLRGQTSRPAQMRRRRSFSGSRVDQRRCRPAVALSFLFRSACSCSGVLWTTGQRLPRTRRQHVRFRAWRAVYYPL